MLNRWPWGKAATHLLWLRTAPTFILTTICVAVFTDIFLYGVVVPVIPYSLQSRVGVAESEVQHWTSVLLAVYGAAVLVASPVCGFLADLCKSRRSPLLLGLVSLAGSTLLLCLGKTLAALVVGRILQGISAALVWSVGLALLADTTPSEKIGQALGFVSISMSMATLLGPLLGGVVYSRAGYFAVFYMVFGIIAVDICLRFLLVEGVRQSEAGPNPRYSAIGYLLSSRRALAAICGVLVVAILLVAWDAVLPLYAHRLFGWNSLGGGLVFLPMILPSFFAPLVGLWSDRKGPRGPVCVCFVLAIPLLVLLRFVSHGGIRQIVLLCALLALLGLATTLGLTPLFAEVTHIVKQEQQRHPHAFGGNSAYATGFGLFNTAFSAGMLLGPLWGGLVMDRAGWPVMCWSLAVLSAFGGAIAFCFVGHSRLSGDRP